MGWILVMFDLPVMTDEERKAAAQFRNHLLDDGYFMVQFSVYARPCVTYESMETHRRALEKIVPAAGNVRVMFFTDQQWAKSYTVVGPNRKYAKYAEPIEMPRQIEFWE